MGCQSRRTAMSWDPACCSTGDRPGDFGWLPSFDGAQRFTHCRITLANGTRALLGRWRACWRIALRSTSDDCPVRRSFSSQHGTGMAPEPTPNTAIREALRNSWLRKALDMGAPRFELGTSSLSGTRSNQLSYAPALKNPSSKYTPHREAQRMRPSLPRRPLHKWHCISQPGAVKPPASKSSRDSHHISRSKG